MVEHKAGRYAVEFLGAQGFSETASGNAQFFARFRVDHWLNPATGQWEESTGLERTWYRVLTEKSVQYFAEDLRQLGYTGQKFSQLDPRHPQAFIISGQQEMVCNIETYEGKQREKWGLMRNGGGEVQLADPGLVKKLDMMFGKALQGGAKPAGGGPPPPPQRQQAGPVAQPQPRTVAQAGAAAAAVADPQAITDDDVPF